MGGSEFLLALAAGTDVAKISMEQDAAENQKEDKLLALRAQQAQARLQAENQVIQNQDKLKQVLAKQELQGIGRGIGVGSQLMSAISINSFNKMEQDNEMVGLNLLAKNVNIDQGISDAYTKYNNQITNSYFNGGVEMAQAGSDYYTFSKGSSAGNGINSSNTKTGSMNSGLKANSLFNFSSYKSNVSSKKSNYNQETNFENMNFYDKNIWND